MSPLLGPSNLNDFLSQHFTRADDAIIRPVNNSMITIVLLIVALVLQH